MVLKGEMQAERRREKERERDGGRQVEGEREKLRGREKNTEKPNQCSDSKRTLEIKASHSEARECRKWDFPGGSVVRTPHLQCKWQRSDSWLGN